MKKIIPVLVFSFVFILNAFSQNKPITKAEYDSAINSAMSKTGKSVYRQSTFAKFYSGKDVTQTRTTINEQLSDERKRTFFKIEANGRVSDSYEFITVGKTEYKKKLNEDWTKTEMSPKFGGSGGGSGTPIESKNLDAYFITKSKADNQERDSYVNFSVVLTGNELYFIEDQRWINSEGLISKSVVKVSRITPENITSVTTSDYKYNPKDLKIEAPIR
jgi:lipopolysaccharide export LptBFGC system permease protein LptF